MSGFAFPQATILVFCKAPLPGRVKTRLFGVLTPVQAAALHARLTVTLIARLAQAALAPIQLCCHPDTEHRFFRALARRYGVGLQRQWGQDLGKRMLLAFHTALTNSQFALAVGCDCPELGAEDLNLALSALADGYDAVLGPAEDGGYVLIGLRRPWPQLFSNLRWGSGEVLAETRQRMALLGLKWRELPVRWDLDRPADLQRWNRTCQRSTPWRRR
jgi:rSAM/selenodomain-associated transferase 1